MAVTNIELEQFSEEHSVSARILDKVVKITNPKEYPTYRMLSTIMRQIDNLVDEGESYPQASLILASQREKTLQAVNGRSTIPTNSFDQTLDEVIRSIEPNLQRPFLNRYLDLLEYFDIDLEHRYTLSPFNKPDLDRHIRGGFTSFFGALKVLLNKSDLSNEPGFLTLAKTHGESEPLGDAAEDLERGLILFSKEDGACWVEELTPGQAVPDRKIDQHIRQKRGAIAQRLFQYAPSASKEFGGAIGLLMTLDYYNRARVTANRRFTPKQPVIFAKYRIN